MSRDWFDPLGIRGSRLDPFTLFTNALRGQGPAGQSAEVIATTMARRLVGRTVSVDAGVKITATVAGVDEARPPAPLAAVPTGAVEVPMWERVRVRLQRIELGEWRLARATLDVHDIRLVGAAAKAIRIGGADFTATVKPGEVVRWAEAIAGERRVRVREGMLEVSDRRLERWVWVTVAVTARDQTVVVRPRHLTAFGRTVPLPPRWQRDVVRPAPWLPTEVQIIGIESDGDDLVATGRVTATDVPVDMTKLLVDLGTESTRSVLRIAIGGR
ncbi:MAG: hypothetical protein RIB98_07380 [Acidimicrobiales bacterium]